MAITINGSGTVTGISVGGLPDGIVDDGTLATSSVTSTKIADGTIVNADVNDVAASKLTGALPAISGASLTNLPGGGKVLQVVYSRTETSVSTTSSTFTDSNLSATITPTSASSKILVLITQMTHKNGSTQDQMAIRLVKDTTILIKWATELLHDNNGLSHNGQSSSYNYLDTPSTTSSTTYKTTFAVRQSNGSTLTCQYAGASSSMTLIEIGA